MNNLSFIQSIGMICMLVIGKGEEAPLALKDTRTTN